MGVLFDYFRAPDDDAVAALMDRLDGGRVVVHGAEPVADALDLKGMEPTTVLGQLVAFALDVPWDPDLVNDEDMWPDDGDSDDEDGDLGNVWVSRLPDSARDILAGIAPERIPQLAAQWSQIEEFEEPGDFHDVTEEGILAVVQDIVGLARRAKAEGEHLYCWASVEGRS